MMLWTANLVFILAVSAPAEPQNPNAPGRGVTAERAAYYQQGLPHAQRFEVRGIPHAMLTPLDEGNDTYLEAFDARGARLGFLRDFTGPVSGADACPCNPLRLTLVFDAKGAFTTLISPEPLQKYGHAAMTEAETALLINLVKKPPAALLAVPRVEAMVDATTGATQLPLKAVVVANAALSTRRIAGIVQDTLAILRGAPASRDRQRLQALFQSPLPDAERAARLAELVPACESDELREQTYRLLVSTYLAALGRGGAVQPAVETQLLDPPVPRQSAGTALVDTCTRFADRGLRPQLVQACVDKLSGPKAPPCKRADLALLRGTAFFQAGDMKNAEPALAEAARHMPVEAAPVLHLRLAQARIACGLRPAACSTASAVYRAHPLLPGAREALMSCVPPADSVASVIDGLAAAAQHALLAQARPTAAPVGNLTLETAAGVTADLPLAVPGQVTIAVFFATWCPHCRAELPRIRDFVAHLSAAEQNSVRVVGIRTAVERETEPYEAFTKNFAPNFPIFTDSTMSMGFVSFARQAGIATGLPTLAVIDGQGQLRYLLEPGDFRDTAQELRWVVDAELARGAARKAL